MTYDEWYTIYLATYKRDLKPRTRESYDDVHGRFIAPALGGRELADISPELLQQAINAAADRGERLAQITYALLHAVLRRANRSRLIDWNPAEAIDKPKHTQQPGRALAADDLEAVLPLMGDDLACALALFAGLRRGEILGLQWGDVDLRRGVLSVRRSRVRVGGRLLSQATKSAAGMRSVPISPELLPILRASFRLSPDAWVCDCAPETISRRWHRIQQDAGIVQAYRLHDLRHTYGTRLILSGCNIKVVQYLMGHSSLEVTARIYAHISADDAAREVARVYASVH